MNTLFRNIPAIAGNGKKVKNVSGFSKMVAAELISGTLSLNGLTMTEPQFSLFTVGDKPDGMKWLIYQTRKAHEEY